MLVRVVSVSICGFPQNLFTGTMWNHDDVLHGNSLRDGSIGCFDDASVGRHRGSGKLLVADFDRKFS